MLTDEHTGRQPQSRPNPTSEDVYDEQTAWPTTTHIKLDIKSKKRFRTNAKQSLMSFEWCVVGPFVRSK
jgi:hypothetical protein